MDTVLKTRTMFRRLRGRERLMRLAAESVPKTREELELERLKSYLLEWADRQKHAYGTRGSADSCLSEYTKSGSPSASELFEQSTGWAMAILDASMDDLIAIKPDGALMRPALRVRYLSEGIAPGGELKIRVFRSGRLEGLSAVAADVLADRAEKALIPITKRRGLPL